MSKLQPFLVRLSTTPHAFLTPDLPLRTDTLSYVKNILDPVAVDVSLAQQERLQDARKKRKRGEAIDEQRVLHLKQIHIKAVSSDQLWEQARRIIDATRREAERGLELVRLHDSQLEVPSDYDGNTGEQAEGLVVESEDSHEEEELDEDLDSDGDITKEALEDNDIEMEDDSSAEENAALQAEEFVPDKFGLNDGFFSIDDFNRQSEFLEQQDTRGEGDGAASDEEGVDWDADPLGIMGVAAGLPTKTPPAALVDEEEDEEGGLTFGDPDASSEDEDEVDEGEMDGIGGLGNTNDILYTDFFAPPAQKRVNNNKEKKKTKHRRPGAIADASRERGDDLQRTMAAVHRDLFEDEDEDDVGEDAIQQLDPVDPRSRKSAHERRQAALAEEIRKLENANVAKREWTMSGEARATDRPMNSLLEEDLEFERTGKPVPVITAEISESIEELIRRRILAQDFQDIIRRRPDDLATGKSRRGRMDFELDDTKSKKGLAAEYEEEHLRSVDPNFVEANDEKSAKEQREIEELWKDISSKLDSLSSWHFRPKQPTAQLDIRVDAPAVSLEDARPNAGGDVAAPRQLAPQEVYKGGAGSKGHTEEVVGKSGLPAVREELSRDERKRRRRREKERIRKNSGNAPAKPESKVAQEKQQILADLKKGKVKVVGKKGEVTDVSGNAIGAGDTALTAAKFKL